jgi:tetratricopeptide (TPR) repeat protein
VKRSQWIVGPWIDLVVGCGAWSAPLLVFAYLVIQSRAERWAVVFYALALVCNYPHYMATIHRAYARSEDRSAYRVFTHYVTAGLIAIGATAHLWPTLLPWLVTAYIMWSPWHYAGQNFGLSMLFLRRAQVAVSARERQWLHTAFVASYVLLLAAFNQGSSGERWVLSLGLSDSIAWSIQVVAAIVFVCGSLLAFGSFVRRSDLRSLVPALTLWSTQALWFVVPVLLAGVSSAAIPRVSYSAGVLALLHSAQYLWITQHYAQRDALRHAESVWSRRRYWSILILGGVALFIPTPWMASLIWQVDFTSSVLIVAAVVNIHHFVLDGVVWKLREPKVSHALVSDDDMSRSRARAARTRLPNAPMWSFRRGLAYAVLAIALIGVALIDQVRYFLSSQSVNVEALKTALVLNPHDGAVHVKLAVAAERDGSRDAATRSLRAAIDANAFDPLPRHRMVKLLTDEGRLADASRVNEELLRVWPRDLDALINAGVFAQRQGDVDAASRWWRRALDIADDRGDVHLYLAELLDAADRPAESIAHYRRHLELLAAAPPGKPDARRAALVIIKFGDALRRTGDREAAMAQFRLAAGIARASGHSEVEALAIEQSRLPVELR